MPLVKLVKLDVMTLRQEQIIDLVRDLRPYGVTLLAEKVETLEQYNFCRDIGFDLFQGYFFAKPIILTGRSVPPSALALLKLLGLIVADAEVEELEHALKQAPSLTLRLLKMVNAAAFGTAKKSPPCAKPFSCSAGCSWAVWCRLCCSPSKMPSGAARKAVPP